MPNIVKEVREKRRKIEQLQRDKAKQEGQKLQLLKRLKDEFGVDTVEAAERKLEILGKELVEDESKLKGLDGEMGKIISDATSKSKSSSTEEG